MFVHIIIINAITITVIQIAKQVKYSPILVTSICKNVGFNIIVACLALLILYYL